MGVPLYFKDQFLAIISKTKGPRIQTIGQKMFLMLFPNILLFWEPFYDLPKPRYGHLKIVKMGVAQKWAWLSQCTDTTTLAPLFCISDMYIKSS